MVLVTLPVTAEAAEILADEAARERAGRLLSSMLRPQRPEDDPMAALIASIKAKAHARGLTDEEVDAELAAYNAERRS